MTGLDRRLPRYRMDCIPNRVHVDHFLLIWELCTTLNIKFAKSHHHQFHVHDYINDQELHDYIMTFYVTEIPDSAHDQAADVKLFQTTQCGKDLVHVCPGFTYSSDALGKFGPVTHQFCKKTIYHHYTPENGESQRKFHARIQNGLYEVPLPQYPERLPTESDTDYAERKEAALYELNQLRRFGPFEPIRKSYM